MPHTLSICHADCYSYIYWCYIFLLCLWFFPSISLQTFLLECCFCDRNISFISFLLVCQQLSFHCQPRWDLCMCLLLFPCNTFMISTPNLVNEFVISACWGPNRTCSTLHRRASISEAIVPLLNFCNAHGIFAGGLLILPNGFLFGYQQAFYKIWCNSRAQLFPSLRKNEIVTAEY